MKSIEEEKDEIEMEESDAKCRARHHSVPFHIVNLLDVSIVPSVHSPVSWYREDKPRNSGR